MYLPYPQLHAGNKCYVPLRVRSQCEGAGECVEREGVTMLPSLPTERLVEWRVGIAEGQSQPSASTAPTHDMVRMYCMCTCTTFCTISSPVTQTLHTYALHVFVPDEDRRGRNVVLLQFTVLCETCDITTDMHYTVLDEAKHLYAYVIHA